MELRPEGGGGGAPQGMYLNDAEVGCVIGEGGLRDVNVSYVLISTGLSPLQKEREMAEALRRKKEAEDAARVQAQVRGGVGGLDVLNSQGLLTDMGLVAICSIH